MRPPEEPDPSRAAATPKPGETTPLEQHNTEIHENIAHWQRKPLLRAVYARFYEAIAGQTRGVPPGAILECGSGIGNLKTVIPDCITSDLFPNPWIDRVENVYALSFPDASVSAVILFDVFHHLEYPGTALAEIRRVLRTGGRLIIFEPAASLLGRWVLGTFHHEPVAFDAPVVWTAPPGWDPHASRYYAAQGNAWRIFRSTASAAPLRNWITSPPRYFPATGWLGAGGFRGPQLIPRACLPLTDLIDRALAPFPGVFATRMLITLEKPVCDTT